MTSACRAHSRPLAQPAPGAQETERLIRDLRLLPEPREWARRARAHPLDPSARRFREQLALPPDRPLFVSGHQAEFWHPGILAKACALGAARRTWGVYVAWLVVDQDANDPLSIRYPVATPPGSFEVGVWRVGGVRPGVPTGRHAPVTPSPHPRDPSIPPFVARGLERIGDELSKARGEASLAAQVGVAHSRLLAPLLEPPPLVYASDIARTDLFCDLVERMRADPGACVRAYNEAARRHPYVGIRPLSFPSASGRVELPLWRISPDGTRAPAHVHDLDAIDPASLAPRAILMTGIMRLAGCDLFIHGTGGAGEDGRGGYDVVTDEWFEAWLGERPRAPFPLATATLFLPLIDGPLPCADEARRSIDDAHRARHSPGLVGDVRAERARRGLVRRIESAPRRSRERRRLFEELHALLEAHRRRNADALRALEGRAAEARRALAGESVLCDRTWPVPFYPEPLLLELKRRVGAGFGGSPPDRS